MATKRKAKSDELTYSQIMSRFKSEWVLLENPRVTKKLEIKSGKVLCHSKDRDEFYKQAIKLHSRNSAIVYTGKLPKAIIL